MEVAFQYGSIVTGNRRWYLVIIILNAPVEHGGTGLSEYFCITEGFECEVNRMKKGVLP